MHPIPPKLRKQLSEDPYYKACARAGTDCDGRITCEHSILYAGKQVQERWAIIPLCAFHHSVDEFQDGPGLNKRINRQIAMSRATEEDKKKYSRLRWRQS
ncbi:MAG: hypothetical protein ACREO5_00165 [Candidatus Binatia bacterium]